MSFAMELLNRKQITRNRRVDDVLLHTLNLAFSGFLLETVLRVGTRITVLTNEKRNQINTKLTNIKQ